MNEEVNEVPTELTDPPKVPAENYEDSKVPAKNDVGSLKNFVHLWKELQTTEGALKGSISTRDKIDVYCLKSWDEMTKMDFLPKEKLTAQNKKGALTFCKGKVID